MMHRTMSGELEAMMSELDRELKQDFPGARLGLRDTYLGTVAGSVAGVSQGAAQMQQKPLERLAVVAERAGMVRENVARLVRDLIGYERVNRTEQVQHAPDKSPEALFELLELYARQIDECLYVIQHELERVREVV